MDGRALTCLAFRYLTPKRRLEFADLLPEMLSSRSFHLICSPARCIEQVDGIMRRRSEELGLEKAQRPLFIWEPVPYVREPLRIDYKEVREPANVQETVTYASPPN